MTWFFRRHVEGTTPLQLPRLLEAIGVRVISRAPWQPPPTPPGAPPSAGPTPAELQRLRAWIGLSLEDTRVDNVEPGSPAARAGLMLGDELIAIDRRRVRSADDIRERLADHQPGERVVLSLFRSGQLHEVSVLVALNPHREFRLELVAPEALAPAIRQLRDDWLATCDPASPVDHCVLRAPAS